MKTGEKGGLWAGEKKRKGQEGEGKAGWFNFLGLLEAQFLK